MKCGRCGSIVEEIHNVSLFNDEIILDTDGMGELLGEDVKEKLLKERKHICTPCANELRVMKNL